MSLEMQRLDKIHSTNQEANGAFLELVAALIIPRIARSKLRLNNEFPKLLNVDICIHIQALWLCVSFFHHLPLPPHQLITHLSHKMF